MDGWFGFTVEAIEPSALAADGVELGPSGRYRHARTHIQTALCAAGFRDLHIEQQILRKESGSDVCGWVVVARRGKH